MVILYKYFMHLNVILFYMLACTEITLFDVLKFKFEFGWVGVRYVRPEDIPVQYGGLSRPGDSANGPPKPASEFTVKGGEKVNIQIEGIEVIQLKISLVYITVLVCRKTLLSTFKRGFVLYRAKPGIYIW